MKKDLEKILLQVEKPARYIGAEVNSVKKDWAKVKLKLALGYPDLYEIGMSSYGLLILYELINQNENYLCERFFLPAQDLAKILKEKQLSLFTLESQKSLKEFDLIGFSLQTELCYTNVLEILNLAQIPLKSKNRLQSFPLVFGGGAVSVNPEPLADFFDFFVLGEAEEVIFEILEVVDKFKNFEKEKLLEELAQIEGIYVPFFYQVEYDSEGLIKEIKPVNKRVKFPVTKRILKNFKDFPVLTKPIVPYIETVHDRANLEIMRGCPWNCRFCQAGYTLKPVRFKTKEKLIEASRELIKNTGYNEISLLSLSSCDYPEIEELTKELSLIFEPQKVSLSLPSIRVEKFNFKIGEQVQLVRKTGVTLAPEAGSERLRKVLNKRITDEEIFKAVEVALKIGLSRLKLYFMIGLPYEEEFDLKAIVELVYKILEMTKNYRFQQLSVNIATFVPKPQTPFQWARFITDEEIEKKQNFLLNNLKNKKIKLMLSEKNLSKLEAILARGDRKLCGVIEKAYQKGALMDAWTEFFRWDLWLEAFEDCQIEPDFYTTRERKVDEVFPWDHLNFGIRKEVLKKEWQNAKFSDVA